MREGVRKGVRQSERVYVGGCEGGVRESVMESGREGVKNWLGRELVWVLGRCTMKEGHVSD